VTYRRPWVASSLGRAVWPPVMAKNILLRTSDRLDGQNSRSR